jgi:hypothetical protein
MFCPQCVSQDIEEHKFSYWRRTHQLPGIPWCMKHGTQLLNASVWTSLRFSRHLIMSKLKRSEVQGKVQPAAVSHFKVGKSLPAS